MTAPGWAFFNAAPAADIIHDDMTPFRRTEVDAALCRPAGQGLRKNDEPLTAAAVGNCVRWLYREISPDGVFRAGPVASVFRIAAPSPAVNH